MLELPTRNRRPISTADSTPVTDENEWSRRASATIASRRAVAAALAVALLLATSTTACRSGRRRAGDVAVLEPSVLPTPRPAPSIVVPASSPTPAAVATPLELGDDAFAVGDYQGARTGYEAHLAGADATIDADRVLYRLAILNLGNGSGRDPGAGFSLLRRLVREHQDSPYRMEAELILGLNARVDGLETEVEKLESQLEALKRIDLERSQDRRSP